MAITLHLHGAPIFIDAFPAAFAAWQAGQSYSARCCITDETVHTLYPTLLEGVPRAVIPPGETHKNLASCESVWQAMLDARLDRRALAVNLGGGVIGDLGGFCAATYKRGIDFVQAPTTLLAMTDAAIGGKLAIDFQGVKNCIGLFRQPAAVFVDPAFLATLPERELRSGMAEVIKHGVIGDPALLDQLAKGKGQMGKGQEANGQGANGQGANGQGANGQGANGQGANGQGANGQMGKGLGEDFSYADWTDLLSASIAVKVRVVEEDPYENGLRALLNFGHTAGHALESYFLDTDTPLTHGEAVAAGMIAEAFLAWGDSARTRALTQLVRRYFEPVDLPDAIFPDLWALMQHDKKNAAGAVRVAVPGEQPFELRVLEPGAETVRESLRFAAAAR